MKNNKKNRKNNKNLKSLDYDKDKDNLFSATVKLGPNSPECIVKNVQVKAETENMTFDDVVFGIDNEIEKLYPSKSYPELDIIGYSVYCNETKQWYPVVSESDVAKIDEIKKSKLYDRYLVLPDALYSVTPEYELWATLREQDPSMMTEFNYDKMHKIIEIANKQKTK